MNLKLIYFISVIFSYVIQFIERYAIVNKLYKDEYHYNDKVRSRAEELATSLAAIIKSLIPIYNILESLKSIYRLIHFKKDYAYYKMSRLASDDISKDNEQDDEEKLIELLSTFADILGADDESKAKIIGSVELANMYQYITDNGFDVDNEFYELNYDKKKEYLENLISKIDSEKNNGLNKSKKYVEMTREEKLNYLRREKEDILNSDNDEQKLIKK